MNEANPSEESDEPYLCIPDGYGDLAARGNPVIRTPHVGQLHSQSVRPTNACQVYVRTN